MNDSQNNETYLLFYKKKWIEGYLIEQVGIFENKRFFLDKENKVHKLTIRSKIKLKSEGLKTYDKKED